MFNLFKSPSPLLTNELWHRQLYIPRADQKQAGVSLGMGEISGNESAGRLQKVLMPNGFYDYQLVLKGGK